MYIVVSARSGRATWNMVRSDLMSLDDAVIVPLERAHWTEHNNGVKAWRHDCNLR